MFPNGMCYARTLVGSISCFLPSSTTITKVKIKMFLSQVSEVCSLALSVPDSADVYLVPAFGGLFAPRWRPDARGTICGLTAFSGRAHLCRAALEALAFQAREVLEAMRRDCRDLGLTSLRVDGGMSQSDQLVQLQADLLGVPILRPSVAETTALGAAVAGTFLLRVYSTYIATIICFR